ncbi:CCA tRNA nucleotidyltransferase [Patescibacteria group bacterium]|nr:CCA tRNA nucleotidyltransferase [Patescibacteria group bacterium]MBU4512706.1 CCA tRNA nucleotidyltransferase [Patescibacteria group bacterium]MCG2688435.1 CCA tRNA nucleotidyltransferase [Candidatus Parcubacteria bacterium]MCG2693167.1 CCA tRNA nucleotidyltransferase [Candidatus Parcubacteria bacterium]
MSKEKLNPVESELKETNEFQMEYLPLNDVEKKAMEVVEALQNSGHKAYFAGGWVRDFLMNKRGHDIDIATSAPPDEVEKIFKSIADKIDATGKNFLVIRARMGDEEFEIATFRKDLGYSDGRRPDGVEIVDDRGDAERRDFTINGMFFDPVSQKLIDYVGGYKDLKDKIVRFIGKAGDRINEDKLRILRAVRFENRLGFSLDKSAKEGIKERAVEVRRLAPERVQEEFSKMLLKKSRAEAIRDLSELKILEHIIPEIETLKGLKQPEEFHEEGDVWEHTLKVLEVLDEDSSLELAWAALLHDIGKPETQTMPQEKADRIRFNGHAKLGADKARIIMRGLRFSTKQVDAVSWAIEHHINIKDVVNMRKGRQRRLLQDPRFELLLRLYKADCEGSSPVRLETYEKIRGLWDDEQKIPQEQKKPLLNGREIMDILGIQPSKTGGGKIIGEIKNALYEAQLEGVVIIKEEANEFVKNYKING